MKIALTKNEEVDIFTQPVSTLVFWLVLLSWKIVEKVLICLRKTAHESWAFDMPWSSCITNCEMFPFQAIRMEFSASRKWTLESTKRSDGS